MPAKSSSASVRSTMIMKCLLVVSCALAVASGASIPRGIHVEVVYDEPKKAADAPGVRNLAEKTQLPLEDLMVIMNNKEDSLEKEMKLVGNPNGVKNVDEKIQLSEEERTHVLKHLPNDVKEEESPLGNMMLLQKAEEMINDGLKSLKLSADKVSSIVTPNEESWKKLNKSVYDFFQEQYRSAGLVKDEIKQDQPGGGNQIIQNIISGFQNFTGNFIQSFQQNQQTVNGTEDEGTGSAPGFAQNFVNAFNGGVQQIISNVQNLGGQQSSTSNTVLGDTGTGTTQAPNIFSNVITSFQQIFSGGSGGPGNPSQVVNANQSDTGVPATTSAPNIIQGAINQFNQVVGNFRPTSATSAPGSQADEPTTTQRGPVQIIQTIGNQIGSAFSNAFGQTTNKPPEDEGTGTTQGGNFFQNVGQAIQNVIRPQGSTQAPVSGGSGGSNPIIEGAQAVGSQIQQLAEGQVSGNNPVESVQNAIAGAVPSTDKGKVPEKVEEKPVEKPLGENPAEKKDEIMETTE